MLSFLKQISSEFFKYTSTLQRDKFISEVENLFTQDNDNINLTGKFTSKDEFQIEPKLKIEPFRGSGLYNPTTIKGYILDNKNEQTHINILVSPNSFIQLLFFALPIFYAVAFFTIEDNRKDLKFYILICTLFVLTPIVLLLLSKALKKSLKNRFVKYFDLS